MLARLTQFHFALDTIRNVTADIDSRAVAAMADPNIGHALSTLQCAIVVSLSGFFESFLRGTAEDCITSINALKLPYGSLPADLRKTNFDNAASILHRRLANRVAWVTAAPEDLARRIGKTVADPPDQTAALLWEAFAEASANPSPKIIINMLAKFGVQHAWNGLAAESGLTQKSIETELISFLAVRNQAAHSGLSNVIPAPSVIRGYCDLLQKVSRGFHEVLRGQFAVPPFNFSFPTAPLLAPANPVPIFLVPTAPIGTGLASPRPFCGGIVEFFGRLFGR